MFSVIVISFLFAVTLTIAATLSFKEKVDPVGLVCAAFAVPAFLLSYFLTSSASRGYPVSIDDAKRRSIYRVVDQFPNGNHFFIAAIPEDGGDAVRVFGVEDTIPSWANCFYVTRKGGKTKVTPISVQDNAPAGN